VPPATRQETVAALVQRARAPSCPEQFGRPRFMAPGDTLSVRKGFVDLFWVELRDGAVHGARRHVIRIEAGASVFGTPILARSGAPVGALMGVGGLDSEIVTQPWADLIAGDAKQGSAIIDAWIAGLSHAAWTRPMGDRHSVAQPGKQIELLPDGVVRAGPRCVAWLSLARGALAWEDAAAAALGPEAGMLPVTEETGATASVASLVDCCDTEAALSRAGPQIVQAIDRFNERALGQLATRFAKADRATVERRFVGSRIAEQEFLADFSQLAVAAGSPRAIRHGTVAGGEAAASAAVRLVAKALGIALPGMPRVPDGSATPLERVSQVADAANIRYRRVVLRGRWWRGDHGPMIGFRGDQHTPVALLPTRGNRYRMVDPSHGDEHPVDAALQHELSGEAVALYRPLPPGALAWRQLVGFSGFGSVRDGLTVVVASLAVGLLALVGPLAIGLIFSTIVPNAERDLLIELVGWLAVVAFSGLLFEAARAIALTRIEGRVEWSLQAGMADRLLALPASFFKSYSSGDLADRLLGFDAIRQTLTGTAVTSLVAIIFSLLNFVLLFLIDLRLAFVAVGLIAVSAGITAILSLGQLRHQRARVDRRGKLGGFVNQLIIGISKLRIAAREQRAAGVWAREAARLTADVIKARRYEALLQVSTEAYPVVAIAIVFFCIVELLPYDGSAAGSLGVGQVLAFSAAFGQLLFALSTLALTLTQSLIAIPLYERARPILTATPEEREQGGLPPRLNGGIEIERVTFRYGRNEPSVLDDVSFAVAPGEFVAVVGRSGSGKSTLLRLILGFERPESGTILFDGRPIENLDLAALRRDMGVVLQSGKLSPGSIYENIVGHTGLTVDDAWQTARLVGLDGDIKAMPMGMHTVVMEGAQTLSGGQRQRLMIARALVRRPRILLLDEATSALDNRTQATVTASLTQLNVTRLVIAHRLSTIQSADRIIVLGRGRIVESGTYTSLMAKDGTFAALAKRQLL
jgi:NHLM bacteriocin system ABC transporter ATP-binding protein